MLVVAVLVVCVVIGSLLPPESAVMVALSSLPLRDKLLRFCAYVAMSALPVIGFRDRRRGMIAGLSIFVLGVVMEAGQQFLPGRAAEFGDVIADGGSVAALCWACRSAPAYIL
jgi:VanZ family protein